MRREEVAAMVDDTDRLRELAHRLWLAEGCPDVPRRELIARASAILARQERTWAAGTKPEVMPFRPAVQTLKPFR